MGEYGATVKAISNGKAIVSAYDGLLRRRANPFSRKFSG